MNKDISELSQRAETARASARLWHLLRWLWITGGIIYVITIPVILITGNATLIIGALIGLFIYMIIGLIIGLICAYKMIVYRKAAYNSIMGLNVSHGFIGPKDECCGHHTSQKQNSEHKKLKSS